MNRGTVIVSAASLVFNYDAIIFDLDGTLVDSHQFPIIASKYLFRRLNLTSEVRFQQYLKALVNDYFHQMDEVVHGAPYKSSFQIIKDAIATGLSAIGLGAADELLTAAAKEFSRLHLELAELFPGTLPLLTKLREHGIQMAAITNSFENHLEIILTRLGVRSFFDVLVDSGVVHTYKPHPRPFEYVVESLEVDKQSVLAVGDEFLADIVGAHNAGLDSVWINYRGNSLEALLAQYGAQNAPRAVVSSISDLLPDTMHK